jgi:hypothetical protein
MPPPVPPAYQSRDFGSTESRGYVSSPGYQPILAPPRAEAGRHSHPNGGDYSQQPEAAQPDQQPRQSGAPAGRHHGEEQAERSPWAPATLPPGYKRIPTARTSPPPEYDEAPAYQDPPISTPASVSRPYARPVDQGPRNESSQWAESRAARAQTAEPVERSRSAELDGHRTLPASLARPASPPGLAQAQAAQAQAAQPQAAQPQPHQVDRAAPAGPARPQASADSPWREPHWSEGPARWSEPARREPVADDQPYSRLLPQRVPAEPDVPSVSGVPDVPAVEPESGGEPAATPELTRIATYLRDEDEEVATTRPDGFNIPAVLAAVRLVPGVRDAQVRTNPSGAHTLRLELADDADPGNVSRMVTRLLNERMGLAAEPNDALLGPAVPTAAPPGRRHTATVPEAPAPELGPPARFDPVPASPAPASTRPAPAPVPAPPASAPARPAAAATSAPAPAPQARATQPRPAELRAVQPVPAEPEPADGRTAEVRTIEGRAAGVRGAAGRAAARATDQGRDSVPAHRPLPGGSGAPRVVLEQVEVSTHSADALVEVRLSTDCGVAVGVANGPAFDGYVLRLAAAAAGNAIDDLLVDSAGARRARCFIEHATVVPLGSCEVAVVVLLLAHGGWIEQLSGSAVVNGDQRQAVVRATLAAVNRRLEALLP